MRRIPSTLEYSVALFLSNGRAKRGCQKMRDSSVGTTGVSTRQKGKKEGVMDEAVGLADSSNDRCKMSMLPRH
jgi:hypothetical protein